MYRFLGSRAAGSISLCLLLTALAVSPASAGRPTVTPAPATGLSGHPTFASAIAADGAFTGAAELRGPIDASKWTLISSLAKGEPPRFEPTIAAASVAAPCTWSAVGGYAGDGALNEVVMALAVSGLDLYVGGRFTDAAGISAADYVAKWDGSAWSALGDDGNGEGAVHDFVNALAVSAGDVYVGGNFLDTAGIPTADHVARWDGSNWHALGDNGAGDGVLSADVYSLAVSSDSLYAAGAFNDAPWLPEADYVAKWNGSTWSAMGSDGALNLFATSLTVSGNDVYVGGGFTDVAGIGAADYVATWDGSFWSALGDNGAGDSAINNEVYALSHLGGDVYVGGLFVGAGGIADADYVARWDGSSWSGFVGSDGGLGGNPFVLAVSGGDLYAGGQVPGRVRRWDGTNWLSVGGDSALDDVVRGLAFSGTDVYGGGWFVDAAGIPEADYVAKCGVAATGDTAPPEITTTISGPQYTNGSDTYVTSDSTLTVNVSDPSGIALCTITISGPGGTTIVPCAEGDTSFSLSGPDGTYTVTVNATDGAGNTATQTETYTLDNTAPTLAPTVSPNPVAQGQSATASPNATDGAGSGVASAGCDPVNTSTVGPQSVTCTATDNLGNTASAQAHYLVYAVAPGGGTFVVGDQSASGQVTFWGAQWAKLNKLSGGPAPSAFKGYAASPSTPSCSGTWTTGPGNSANPPAGPLPAYMAVIVTSSTGKSCSAITGNSVHVVVVKTNPGYSANPGHAGTGTVVATIC